MFAERLLDGEVEAMVRTAIEKAKQGDMVDLARKPNRHLAFGTGIHFCLGHQLARLEGICALKALFRRWPKLELAVDESEIKWRRRAGLRAIDHLLVAMPSVGLSVDRGVRVAALTG
jgi:hypothetical protein